MTLVAYLAGSDKAHKVRVGDMGLTTRADGQPGFGSIIFDDPDKDLTVRGWMKVVVHETACTTAPILFSGYIAPRRYSRVGPSSTYKSGGSRWIDCTLVDENAVLGIRVISGADGKRPAETHNERIDWLLASAYLSGLIESDSLVDTSNPRPFEEADYRGQFPDSVLDSLAGPIFKTFFVYVDGLTGDRILFFDSPSATVGASDLSISNALGEADGDTIFEPLLDGELVMDPSQVVAKDRYTYAKGTVIESNVTTRDTFFLDNDLGWRGRQDDNTRIGSETSARIMAQGILSRNSEEEETVTCRIILPNTKVGLVRAGQRIEATFEHYDGWETGKFSRVTECSVTQWNDRSDLYLVTLELNTHGKANSGGGGAPGPGTLPHPTGAGSVVQTGCGNSLGSSVDLTFPSPMSSGHMLVAWVTSRGNSTGITPPDGTWTQIGSTVSLYDSGNLSYSPCSMWYKIADSTEDGQTSVQFGSTGGSSRPKVLGWELDGVGAPTATVGLDQIPNGPGTPRTGGFGALSSSSGINIVGIGAGSDYPDPITITPSDHTFIEAGDQFAPTALGADQIVTGAETYGFTYTFAVSGLDRHCGVAAFFPLTGSSADPPSPGQWVGLSPHEIVALTGASGTTQFPFADGSLRVYVDDLDQTANLVSQDGATGAFTLGFTPTPTEVVRVEYQGR